MSKKEPRSCADTELGSYHKAVGYMQPSLTTRLLDMAGQENCDGEPYDTMQEAAEKLNNLIEAAENYIACIDQFTGYRYTSRDLLVQAIKNAKA